MDNVADTLATTATKTRRKPEKPTLYSKHPLIKVDRRTKEARLMKQVRAELEAHVGPNPSYPQRVLIDRAVFLTLRVAQIDAKILAGEELTTHDSNFALAWNNSLRRTLLALGVEAWTPPPPDWRTIVAEFGGKAAT